ncbi:hypothetical protein STABA_v1c03320 [Spiroplasma tabanidicola]|uniref:Transmembrane protein n=2 Tax=Spiroplasma tabanidicola TaxID=324079 RepID=A0A6I6C9T9_9MOLU|nr:hypothetical protein STABA_v1c03320 [Spiroplasma tabanidicola]
MLLAGTWNNGAIDQKNILLILIVQLCVIVVPTIYTYVLFFKFQKVDVDKKKFNTKWFAIVAALQILTMVPQIVGWLMYFGEKIMPNNYDMALYIAWGCVGAVFALVATWYILLFFFPQRIWVFFDEEKLFVFDKGIKKEKIVNILNDQSSNMLYINYTEGKTSLKKIAIPFKSTTAEFIWVSALSEGLEKFEGSEAIFFKEKSISLKMGDPAEEENIQQVPTQVIIDGQEIDPNQQYMDNQQLYPNQQYMDNQQLYPNQQYMENQQLDPNQQYMDNQQLDQNQQYMENQQLDQNQQYYGQDNMNNPEPQNQEFYQDVPNEQSQNNEEDALFKDGDFDD